jgi:hypothetical protein
MHKHAQLIERVYAGIANHDLTAISECYHEDARFRDIAFECQGRARIHQMWHLVCHSGRPAVSGTSFDANDRSGSGKWHAEYWIDRTDDDPGRFVVNDLRSTFTFRDGLILEHHDRCNWFKWANQAFPFPKNVAAYVPAVRKKGAEDKLAKFLAKNPAPPLPPPRPV